LAYDEYLKDALDRKYFTTVGEIQKPIRKKNKCYRKKNENLNAALVSYELEQG